MVLEHVHLHDSGSWNPRRLLLDSFASKCIKMERTRALLESFNGRNLGTNSKAKLDRSVTGTKYPVRTFATSWYVTCKTVSFQWSVALVHNVEANS